MQAKYIPALKCVQEGNVQHAYTMVESAFLTGNVVVIVVRDLQAIQPDVVVQHPLLMGGMVGETL